MIPQLHGEDLAQWLEQVRAEIFAAESVAGMYEEDQ